jgi:hypothetical protein
LLILRRLPARADAILDETLDLIWLVSKPSSSTTTPHRLQSEAPALFRGYSNKDIPYFAHIALICTFLASFGSAFAVSISRKQKSKEPTWRDLILLSIATHKLSRIIGKDRVTAPFRAPFTRLTGDSGSGEVEETARGEGLQHAIGELLSCPFCLAPWVAAALLTGLLNAPRLTRIVGALFSIVTGSDFLNRVYYGAKQIGESDRSGS